MLTLKEFMELVDYKITEGSDYWPEGNFGGRQLYSLSAWNGDHNGWSFNIGFDPKHDQRVYVVEVCDYKHNRAYRLIDSSLKTDKEAWDGVNYVDLEEDDDFIQKALSIKAGEDYDTRVEVPLTVPDDVLFELMKRAHEKDITLNQLVEDVLWDAIRTEEANRLDSIIDDFDEDEWDKLAEDHWDDDGNDIHETNTDDPVDFPVSAIKAKKKKKK
jgi:hypothetical protein